MFDIVPFKAEHLEALKGQNINRHLPEWIRHGHAIDMEKTNAVSGVLNGEVMVCGGVTHLWTNRGHIWSLFNENSRTCFLPVYRGIRRWLYSQPYHRLEMCIPCNFWQGKRRAEMLGFRVECERAEKYLPNGEACSIYALVR